MIETVLFRILLSLFETYPEGLGVSKVGRSGYVLARPRRRRASRPNATLVRRSMLPGVAGKPPVPSGVLQSPLLIGKLT